MMLAHIAILWNSWMNMSVHVYYFMGISDMSILRVCININTRFTPHQIFIGFTIANSYTHNGEENINTDICTDNIRNVYIMYRSIHLQSKKSTGNGSWHGCIIFVKLNLTVVSIWISRWTAKTYLFVSLWYQAVHSRCFYMYYAN